jgi:hypothetical protein
MSFLPASNLPNSIIGSVGHVLKEPDKECQWYFKEKIYKKTDAGIEWGGEYTGRTYCMYTCCNTKSKPGTKFVDISCCPNLAKLDIQCALLERARVLEGYYVARHGKEEG